MKVELLQITPDIEKHVEFCGRNCYQSFDNIKEESHKTFIKGIIMSGHTSVLEHGFASFFIKDVSRALMGQITRHRLSSFCIKSQRYVNEENFNYVTPPSILESGENSIVLQEYVNLMDQAKETYEFLVNSGVKKEDARMVLPNATTTDIVMSANMREWRHIFNLRLHKSAQWEIREMCNQILAILIEKAPTIFYDFSESK